MQLSDIVKLVVTSTNHHDLHEQLNSLSEKHPNVFKNKKDGVGYTCAATLLTPAVTIHKNNDGEWQITCDDPSLCLPQIDHPTYKVRMLKLADCKKFIKNGNNMQIFSLGYDVISHENVRAIAEHNQIDANSKNLPLYQARYEFACQHMKSQQVELEACYMGGDIMLFACYEQGKTGLVVFHQNGMEFFSGLNKILRAMRFIYYAVSDNLRKVDKPIHAIELGTIFENVKYDSDRPRRYFEVTQLNMLSTKLGGEITIRCIAFDAHGTPIRGKYLTGDIPCFVTYNSEDKRYEAHATVNNNLRYAVLRTQSPSIDDKLAA